MSWCTDPTFNFYPVRTLLILQYTILILTVQIVVLDVCMMVMKINQAYISVSLPDTVCIQHTNFFL